MLTLILEKFKLDKSLQSLKMLEMSKAKIAGLLPDEIQGAIGQGLVKVKDPNDPATADNLELDRKRY